MTTQRTITLSADQWDVILDAVECYCDEGPPGEGWKSARLSAAATALISALDRFKPELPTLKEQALQDVDEILKNPGSPVHSDFDRIIAALKELPDHS